MVNLAKTNLMLIPQVSFQSFLEETDDRLLQFSHLERAACLSVSEDNKHIHIQAAIPGINPDDVEIFYENGMVWLKVDEDKGKKNKQRYLCRDPRSFSYRIPVSGNIDQNIQPKADFNHGMVMITFMKPG